MGFIQTSSLRSLRSAGIASCSHDTNMILFQASSLRSLRSAGIASHSRSYGASLVFTGGQQAAAFFGIPIIDLVGILFFTPKGAPLCFRVFLWALFRHHPCAHCVRQGFLPTADHTALRLYSRVVSKPPPSLGSRSLIWSGSFFFTPKGAPLCFRVFLWALFRHHPCAHCVRQGFLPAAIHTSLRSYSWAGRKTKREAPSCLPPCSFDQITIKSSANPLHLSAEGWKNP